ncbi:23S rRNA (adenine(1618)-N(6))-methyltransferase RlmF [Saccharophagus degradans]|uniref:23S rRNA (adenine(1618)-N(6))-methyltransferase RlmF n=1 Tax=Saccharophagus degradans TaxID=86304 RepID=UPI002477F320|nr:23S rRNA (adenine(1618)-N(6))-methyltransferase RlmF [Saccharophagus degradans]WGO98287.1 23S rRNA (adenine(1618)-N(6))-methyltransferase RlmF [Saccharophagus degradans]
MQKSANSKTRKQSKGLHPRNIHRNGYDFDALKACHPPLAQHIKSNPAGAATIDFANIDAVKALNTALLQHHYKIESWSIPDGALCPPIPGRVDYIHYIAELLGCPLPSGKINTANTCTANANTSNTRTNNPLNLLDVGTGANGIYALLACAVYGWRCVGSDINSESLANVKAVLTNNPTLNANISLRLQPNKDAFFSQIIQTDEYFDVSVCNPPFHASQEEASKGTNRKLHNLARSRDTAHTAKQPSLNFGGQHAELWCNGGERLFLKKMIKESQDFAQQVGWFTSLVSKSENVQPALKLIRKLGATEVREIEMMQGNKITRVIAWRFNP